MKKHIIAIAVTLNCSFIMAQTEFDALRYSPIDINGTARYMSMAGAFGALGGDASAIKDNPAGLGIYRKSEMAATLNAQMLSTSAKWNGSRIDYNNPFKSKISTFSLVLASSGNNSSSGLLNSNWSFGYSRLKDYNRSLKINGGSSNSSITQYMANFTDGFRKDELQFSKDINELFDNQYIPSLSIYGYQGYLIDSTGVKKWGSSINNKITPSYQLTEKGHLDEYSFGWAGNVSNLVYFGVTVNILSLNYSGIAKYSESFSDEGYMSLGDSIYTKGTGVNFNIGVIVRPTDNLRFGLAIHTPTLYNLKDNYYSTLEYDRVFKVNGKPQGEAIGTIVGPIASNDYQLQNPMQINASVAYILGKRALLSAEYVFTNYAGIKLMDDNGDSQAFDLENEGMKTALKNVSTIKLGGEYKFTENFSGRLGYAHIGSATETNAIKYLRSESKRADTQYFRNNGTNYFSAGFGYRESSWYIDFAYVHKILDESFYPYNSDSYAKNTPSMAVSAASVKTSTNNLVATFGFKF